ncbi:hypothetical protein CEXT_449401, partial [Caerostris extrusa]
NNLKLGK